MKLSDDGSQVTLTIQEFQSGSPSSTSTMVTATVREPYEHEVNITVEMEDDREPWEALMDFQGNTVEIVCDIAPGSGELTSKPSMISLDD